jgi:hypothetical protein
MRKANESMTTLQQALAHTQDGGAHYTPRDIVITNDDCNHHLEMAAFHLYEAERAQRADRGLPVWSHAPNAMRVDARYRIRSAHHRGDISIKAKLPLLLSQSLALFDGYIWPLCDNKPRPDGMSLTQFKAVVAERRQGYFHKGQILMTTIFNYLDVTAWGEPERQRLEQVERFGKMRGDDTEAVKAWKDIRDGGGASRLAQALVELDRPKGWVEPDARD